MRITAVAIMDTPNIIILGFCELTWADGFVVTRFGRPFINPHGRELVELVLMFGMC